MHLPNFIKLALINNTTSLGSHPALPPDDEMSFISHIICDRYEDIMSKVNTNDPKKLSSRLSYLVNECIKIESNNKNALEKLCMDTITKLFQIPDDTIIINSHIVDHCDMSKYRMVPEPTNDFVFDDIMDMNNLSDEIYKRRMINCLIAGCSLYYAMNTSLYENEISKINPYLNDLYKEIILYNNALLFNKSDSINGMKKTDSGKVDVLIGDENERIKINAEGVIFPVLLEYTIKGLLEIASNVGLPEDRKRAQYIMNKADYRLAENWDMRLGIPLWQKLLHSFEQAQYDINNIGSNFIIMELSKLNPGTFNKYLQNAFMLTNKGIIMSKELCDTIEYNKNLDDFDNFIKTQNSKYSINDSDEYTAEELLSEITN